MTVTERITALRKQMKEKGIDAYLVPTDDFHGSEYVGDYFKCRKYITGFTGSAGTAVIMQDMAGLWTDGRYFIQAAKQLEGTTVELMKMGQPGVPKIGEYLETALAEGETVGFDGRVVSVTEGEEYEKIASEKNGKVVYAYDLIDEVWEDRPILSEEPVFELEQKYTGETVESKLARTRAAMKEACEKRGVKFYYPSPIFCTDNAAMIGVAAYYEYINGTRSGWDLNAVPNLKLGER